MNKPLSKSLIGIIALVIFGFSFSTAYWGTVEKERESIAAAQAEQNKVPIKDQAQVGTYIDVDSPAPAGYVVLNDNYRFRYGYDGVPVEFVGRWYVRREGDIGHSFVYLIVDGEVEAAARFRVGKGKLTDTENNNVYFRRDGLEARVKGSRKN